MKKYLSLAFNDDHSKNPTIKEWLVREGNRLSAQSPLFTMEAQGQVSTFTSPLNGIFKIFLCKVGEPLIQGKLIAVVELGEEEFKQALNRGWGEELTPEEAKKGFSYAEAASIRLPPEK